MAEKDKKKKQMYIYIGIGLVVIILLFIFVIPKITGNKKGESINRFRVPYNKPLLERR